MISDVEVAAISAAGACFVTMIGFVWKAATTTTEHRMRLEKLEKEGERLARAVDRLTEAVNRLDKRLAVSNARSSQGQFDEGDTVPPRGEDR